MAADDSEEPLMYASAETGEVLILEPLAEVTYTDFLGVLSGLGRVLILGDIQALPKAPEAGNGVIAPGAAVPLVESGHFLSRAEDYKAIQVATAADVCRLDAAAKAQGVVLHAIV